MTPTYWSLPTMYKLDSKGKTRVRKSVVRLNSDGSATWTIETGILDGKMVQKKTVYKDGKQGRDGFEQACFEANSKHEKKQKKEKYCENIEDIASGGDFDLMVPMTAKKVQDAKKLKLPYYMQPKLDGNRCMIRIKEDGTIIKWSRDGNVFDNLEHLDGSLARIGEIYYRDIKKINPNLPELVLDGEMFTWQMPFKDINGSLKSPKKKLNELSGAKLTKAQDQLRRRLLLQFWWYDIVNDQPFKSRIFTMGDITTAANIRTSLTSNIDEEPIVAVETIGVTDQKAADGLHTLFLSNGYEGSMIRTPEGLYKHGRSSDLLKRKECQDAEYKIIRIDAMDKYPKQGMYICENPHGGDEIKATPKCSFPEREHLLAHPEEVLGKMLTIEFFETFEDGTPRFSVGVRIREER